MSLTTKAVWVIERNLDRPLTLGEVAEACGVSRHHLAHAFGRAAGRSVMHYIRARRLSLAARALAAGAPDILGLALDAGYGSHEAFSRAFRAQFGAAPERVRRKASTEDLAMIEAMRISDQGGAELSPPRFVAAAPMLFVGLSRKHSIGNPQGIPAQWLEFMARYGDIPDKARPIPVGIVADLNEDGDFDYICAAEVARLSAVPRGLAQLRAPAQSYAVFLHSDHVSTIGATYSAIWNHWLPEHNRAAADGVSLEIHLDAFNPQTGLGGVELWIPLEESA